MADRGPRPKQHHDEDDSVTLHPVVTAVRAVRAVPPARAESPLLPAAAWSAMMAAVLPMADSTVRAIPRTAKILLDSPSPDPALGFGAIAGAFATIIETSEPRFAIGIFGDWGSGKTTLMNAIEGKLSPRMSIPVRFNAWRYEREPELLIPLLDTIRQGLVDWAPGQDTDERNKRAREAARVIGRVVRALVAGVSVQIPIGPAALTYDAGKAIDGLTGSQADDTADKPQSLYFAGFQALSKAFEDFAADGGARIVVFVDDLDRCLPSNALAVLEAMKLFFDLPGFVFVAGLDEDIVEKAVESRVSQAIAMAPVDDKPRPSSAYAANAELGGEYLKKLFQVPYSLPPVVAEQLDDLLDAMYRHAALEPDQVDDLRARVRPYLRYLARDERVNPREVKRFINAYTIQTLVRPELTREVVLALQTIAFRAEWEGAYDLVLTDSAVFREAVSAFRQGQANALEQISPDGAVLPSDFLAYVASDEAEPLASDVDLEPYLFSLQSAGTQRWFVDAYDALGEIRRRIPLISAEGSDLARVSSDISEQAQRLNAVLPGPSTTGGSGLGGLVHMFSDMAGTLSANPQLAQKDLTEIAASVSRTVTRLQAELRALRRRAMLESGS